MHGARIADFTKGKRLARWDHIVEWVKPKQCPKGLKKKLFDQLPQRILLRETRFHITQKGFRTEDVTLVTTLLDPKCYTRIDLLICMGFVGPNRIGIQSNMQRLTSSI